MISNWEEISLSRAHLLRLACRFAAFRRRIPLSAFILFRGNRSRALARARSRGREREGKQCGENYLLVCCQASGRKFHSFEVLSNIQY